MKFYCVILRQGPRRDESFMPPLYTQPNCANAVRDVLCRLEDSIQTGKCSFTVIFYMYKFGTLSIWFMWN
jgi:hypothetical protein